MKTFFRRFLAVGAWVIALLALPAAFATPTISFTPAAFPATGSPVAVASTPAGLTISVNASPTGGATISSVAFSINGTSLGTATGTSPFTINWVPTTAGNFTITATVTDTSAIATGTTNTATINSIVTITKARVTTMALTGASNTYAQGSSIFFRSTATMSDALVASVSFYLDPTDPNNPATTGTVVTNNLNKTSVTQAPYNAAVTLSGANGFTVGQHILYAVAANSDSTILVSSTPTTINIAAPFAGNQPPTVSLTAPTTGSFVAVGQSVTVSATATDADGFIPSTTGTGVTFFVDGDPIAPTGTGETNPRLVPPYTLTWKPTLAKTYSLQALTVDDKSAYVLSAPITVTAVSTLPTISITSPTAASSLATSTATTVTANVTPSTGAAITSVQFFANGVLIPGNVTIGATSSISWTTPATPQTVSLTAQVTDSNGITGTSAAVSVTIVASPPTVALTSPLAGSTLALSTPINLTATATAGTGATVQKVEFFAAGTLVGTAISPQAGVYTAQWTPSTAGAVALTAKVTDSNNTAVTSSTVNVTVTGPSIAITSPAAGTTLQLNAATTLTANVSVGTGASVANVQFFASGLLVATVNNPTLGSNSTTWTPTTTGTVSLTARLVDSNNVIVTSSAVSVTVSAFPPTVALTAPVTGSTFTAGTAVALSANATATGGATLTKVDFYAGANLIVSVPAPSAITTGQFPGSWTPAAAGSFSLTAKVTDSTGNVVTSSAVTVTVTAATPTVALTSPVQGASLGLNTSVQLIATATGGNGAAVAKVEFLAGTTVVFTALSPVGGNFNGLWTPTTSGIIALTARVTDINGATATSSIVNVSVGAPTVSISSPTAGTTLGLGIPVTLTATAATVAPATVTSVDFLAAGVVVGTATTAPYSITWTPSATGSVSLTARVTDSNGSIVTSTGVSVTVSSAPATVSLSSPVAGASFATGSGVPLVANVTPGSASVSRVDFLVGSTVVGTDLTPPYTFTWTPTASNIGIVALAVRTTDANGATVTSSAVDVVIVAAPRVVTLTSPTAGTTLPVGSPTFLRATASFSDGVVARVDFYANGVVVGSSSAQPYNVTYSFGIAGSYSVFARAVATDNTTMDSPPVTVNVVPAVGQPPTVAIATPTSGSYLPVGTASTITGNSADPGSIVSSVQVYANGVSIGSATIAPNGTWTINWTPSAIGTASLVAIATDSNSNAVASPAILVNVTDTTSPSIALGVTPGTTVLPAGATRNILATVTPTAGRAITRVEFFINGSKPSSGGDKTIPPYSYRFVAPTAPGNYIFTARATDNTGLARDAQVILTVVSAVGTAPTINLLTPTSNTTAIPNITSLSLAASAQSSGSIASVQFYANGSPVGSPISPPTNFATAFTPTAPGNYVFDAIATDDRGNTTVSNAVTVTAAFGTPTITMTAPNPNVSSRATPLVPFTISANAVAGTGASVVLVEYLLDGAQIGTRTTPTSGSIYTLAWTPTVAQLGTHQLTVRITDTDSLTATSTPAATVTVANSTGSPPQFTSVTTSPTPSAGLQTLSQVNFVANVAAASPATLRTVAFFLNDVNVGNAVQEGTNSWRLVFDFSKYDFTQVTPDPTTGRYPITLYAIATDSNNNQTISNTTTLQLNPATSAAPTLQVQNLNGTTTVSQNTAFSLLVTATDTDGTIASVQLYANGVVSNASILNLGAQYLITYPSSTVGTFNLAVVATDDSGISVVSNPAIRLTVNQVAPATSTLTRPTDDNTVTTVGAPVFLEATATAGTANQSPSSVQFTITPLVTNNRTQTTITATRIGTTNTYRQVYTPTTADTYTIGTQATFSGVTTPGSLTHQVVVNNVVGIAPVVSAISFTPNTTTFTSASTANFSVTATDADGAVASVEFFVNRNSIGKATRDGLSNTWRISYSFAGLALNTATEVEAIATDTAGNITASPSPITNITVTAATGAAPFVTIAATPSTAAFTQAIALTANASSATGTVSSVQYFVNGVSVGSSGNASNNYQVTLNTGTNPSLPTSAAGTYNVYALVTDNANNTTISPTIPVTVKRNNPITDNDAFILQTYQDLVNRTANSVELTTYDALFASGSITRGQLVNTLLTSTSTNATYNQVVNALAAYYVIMGQWPTSTNYTTLFNARGTLANVCGNVITSSEYVLKYPEHVVPTVALLNNAAGTSPITAAQLLSRFVSNAGLSVPNFQLLLKQFQDNDTANLALGVGRGYNVVGLNVAIAEFVTNTNVNNTALFNNARAAALFYMLDKPDIFPGTVLDPSDPAGSLLVPDAAARIAAIAKSSDFATMATTALGDILYTYRYVTITSQPKSLTVNARSGALFNVAAIGQPPIAYQWLLNGTPIAGATSTVLSVNNVDGTKTGLYSVVVTTPAGSAISDPATLSLTATPTRVSNLSTRGLTSSGADVLIGGFVVSGNANQTRQMLVRVVGPGLASVGLTSGFLADPRLEIYGAQSSVTPLLTNDNWGTQGGNANANATAVAAIVAATQRVGTFPLTTNSLDAAVLVTVSPGTYTVEAKGLAANASGVVLLEVYDVAAAGANAARAVNISTRGAVGTGANILIAGFVIEGAASRRMLIRGVGPTLSKFGVAAPLADPQIELFDSAGNSLAVNDNWASGSDAALIAAAANNAGAFALANGSKDSAMLIMLPPGAYTVHLSGVGTTNNTGVGMIEVYDVDP